MSSLAIQRVCEEYEGSSMFGMNGGQPESPDGKLIVYAKKPKLEEQKTEVWVCDCTDFGNARKIFEVNCGNHNGPSATFVDNEHIVFRDGINKLAVFRIVNVYTGEVKYGPVFAKESHCAENGWYPFSISEEYLGKNPQFPEIDTCGIYMLQLGTGKVRKIADKDAMYRMVVEHDCVPNKFTTSVSHVQLNPSATRVMMRLSVDNCPIFGALGCIDIETGESHVIKDKPVHQLWYDDDTYMATRQYHNGERIEMETSRIQRFTPDGECLETLGGIGNHIDGSPDRNWYTGDRAYPDYNTDIFLYKRGDINPAAVFGGHNFQELTWKKKVHPNPTFSRDGKRIYFNYGVSNDRAQACFVDISSIIG